MSQDYLKLIEEHGKESTINLFEKVLITAKRAKSLYELDELSRQYGHAHERAQYERDGHAPAA